MHDLRVAARRLMVWCDLLTWLQAGDSVTAARRRVKRLLRALSALRDWQVQLELLQEMPRTANAGARVCRRWYLREIEVEMKRVDRRCRKVEAKKIVAGLKDGLKSVIQQRGRRPGLDQPAFDVRPWVVALVAQANQARRRVDAADPETLHRLRIELKHLRYALEALADSPAASTKTELRRLRAVLDLLGEIQDADLFQRRLGEAAKERPRQAGALVVLVRWLQRRREARIRRFLRGAKDLKQLLETCQPRSH